MKLIMFFFSLNQHYDIIICVYWFELFSQVSDVAHGPLVFGLMTLKWISLRLNKTLILCIHRCIHKMMITCTVIGLCSRKCTCIQIVEWSKTLCFGVFEQFWFIISCQWLLGFIRFVVQLWYTYINIIKYFRLCTVCRCRVAVLISRNYSTWIYFLSCSSAVISQGMLQWKPCTFC